MKFQLKDPMLLSVRVEGERGIVRELTAALDFNHPYCAILSQDAIDLGYPEAANKHTDEERQFPERVPWFTSYAGIQRGILVSLHKVSLGRLSARDVDAVVLELEYPRLMPVDFVLGRTFLKNFKLTVDVKGRTLSLK